jgi:acetyltransferase-like isoleucine patch superfamily enzyme
MDIHMNRFFKNLFSMHAYHETARERKKLRDRHIEFKGGKPTDLNIGDHSYINGMKIYSWGTLSRVSIGKYCSIADDVTLIAGGEHHTGWVSSFPFIDRWQLKDTIFFDRKGSQTKGDISIGHDVWIGHGVTILSGVTIGHGAVIGAMAVIAKDVPPYAVVVGNPAKIIKYRFDSLMINAFLKIEWWNWPDTDVEQTQYLFSSPEKFVEMFIDKS